MTLVAVGVIEAVVPVGVNDVVGAVVAVGVIDAADVAVGVNDVGGAAPGGACNIAALECSCTTNAPPHMRR